MKKLLIILTMLLNACQPTPVIAAVVPSPTTEAWRVPLMKSVAYSETDQKYTPENKKFVEGVFPTFKINEPVNWDCYTLNDTNHSPFSIPKYYETVLSRRGYQVKYNAYDPKLHGGTAIYTKDKSTIYLQYSAGLNDVNKLPLILVIYKNVQ
jgi:hypothetical protein